MEHIRDLRLEMRPITSLALDARNPRTHTPKQIRQIADSIGQFGFTNPILIDQKGGVIAGHGRLLAAKLLGMIEVPTIRLDQMTEAQKRAYLIADNRLAEKAGWDRELLSLQLSNITELEIDFDLTITGFDVAEIDLLLETSDSNEKDNEADQVPEVDHNKPSVSRSGDLWMLGPHRLLCADATHAGSFDCLLEGEQAGMVFIDPPYNLRIAGNVSGLGKIKHREFAMASGEMSETEFTAFLTTSFEKLVQHSVDGSIHFICIDWRHLGELLAAGSQVYSALKNLCVWVKESAGMGSLYRSHHELVFVFKSGGAAHTNNVQLGVYGRNRSNVWNYPGTNSLRKDRLDELAMHPTVKPVPLIADAILDCSERGEIVLDCFGGSGTTVVAAEKTGRRAYVMELDTAYVDVAVQRFEKITEIPARHAATQQTFAEVARQRSAEPHPCLNDDSRGGNADGE